jgi:hypothetical protein
MRMPRPRIYTDEELAAHEKEQQRKYREKNKEKLKANRHAYYEANKQAAVDWAKKYNKEHRKELTDKHREYCEKNREKINAYHREYRVSHAEKIREAENKSKIASPEKMWAKRQFNSALNSGFLVRPGSCEKCGGECTPQGHNQDYNKPLFVQWLCSRCHGEADRLRRSEEVASS